MKQAELVKTQFSQILQQKIRFQQLLNCQICYCKVAQPTMCPHCSKLYCQMCISKSLKLKAECPNCRKAIKGQLTNCSRFLNELSQIVNNLVEFGEQIQKCQEHGINLNYFCQDCSKSACCECKMFGEHQLHKFKPIALIYQEKYNTIRQLLTKFKSSIIHQEQDLFQIQNDLIAIKKGVQTQIMQIDLFTDKYKEKMAIQQSIESKGQNQAAQTLLRMVQQLDSLRNQIQNKVTQAKRSHCYKKDHQLTNKMQATLNRCKQMLTVNKNMGSLEEVIPPYKKFTFLVQNYSDRKQDLTPLNSQPMEYEGSLWRLTVYLKGKSHNCNNLSVFVQLIKNPDNINHYEYTVQLINHSDIKKSIVKQHQARFEIKECWGYSKLISNQQLQASSFVHKQKDYLEICFGVRFCYYHDLYQRRKGLIEYIDAQIKEQDEQIAKLQTIVAQGSTTSIKY